MGQEHVRVLASFESGVSLEHDIGYFLSRSSWKNVCHISFDTLEARRNGLREEFLPSTG